MNLKSKLLINSLFIGLSALGPSETPELNTSVLNVKAKEESVYIVQSGDNLYRIALNHQVDLGLFKEINKKEDNLIHPGDVLVLPSEEATKKREPKEVETKREQVYGKELSKEQYRTLLEVVQQESGGHDYEATLAVVSVITNRVDTSWYQDSVWEVITARGQFEAYGAGHYTRHRGKVTDTTKRAVRDGLNGKKNVSVLNFWSDWYYKKQGRNDEEAINIGGNIFFNL